MSSHCPTCAAFVRWASIWEGRRLAGDDARSFEAERDVLDLQRRAAA